MAERNCTAIGVHARIIVGHAQLVEHGNILGDEGLVELDQADRVE